MEEQMYNTHDILKIMTTEEILERNVYDLQEQLNNANKRIVELQEELDKRTIIVNENR
jgi:TolA-binding protein|tara:strand:- start:97 stop:270 length:174 start_codon:yes stop_codon:yes gene_type:complete